MKVVVGKRGQNTPIFSDVMETVVFSPYWHIPDTIAAGETIPAVARDAGYLARQKIEVLRPSKQGLTRIDPADVDWDNPAETRGLVFRQLPGAHNSLGHVKFLFPNAFNVYLHDTPADELFARPGRAFSHGCVRLETPEALARYVLRGQPEWTDERIRRAMLAGTEHQVALASPIPVHLAYFTAWVDDDGALRFFSDVYKYD
jgi:murein L,D-transpeptidase YcbB/YkuD